MRAVAVNEEACRAVAEAGGVGAALRLVQLSTAAGGSERVGRAAVSLLRQLAGSDVIKAAFLEAGGFAAAAAFCTAHGKQAASAAAALALLVAATLRSPECAAAAAAAGCLDAALVAMEAHPGAAGLQRQGCMFVRNCAVRNEELRPVALEKGAEALLRRAKASHPNECTDVGSAALRDLGCDNYNENYKPTTIFMGADGQARALPAEGGRVEGVGFRSMSRCQPVEARESSLSGGRAIPGRSICALSRTSLDGMFEAAELVTHEAATAHAREPKLGVYIRGRCARTRSWRWWRRARK